MLKMLFFDGRDYEVLDGFTRKLEPARKHRGNPVMLNDGPFDGDRLSFYGSVIRRPDGLWQMWYNTFQDGPAIAYAESDDGVAWLRPELDVIRRKRKKTNLVFDQHPHGPCVFYDAAEDRAGWRYKMLTGAAPSHRICAFRSADGLHWSPAAENPVTGSNPDCPMSLHRARDGRFVAYHRPGFGDRRVGRSESWDFVHWSEPKMVLGQDPRDDPQTQFYGLGAVPYGGYEIGTLWVYHTEHDDMDFYKMTGRQEPELVYSRSGYAWHRAELGTPWIKLGRKGAWDAGSIQCASAPVFLEDEIRFYYVGNRSTHGERWTGKGSGSAVGFACIKPDRFVSVEAKTNGRILTRPFWTEAPEFWLNANVRKGGSVRVEIADIDGKPIKGFALKNSWPVTGDSLRHRLRWEGDPDAASLADRQLRLRVRAKHAKLYALSAGAEEDLADTTRFRIPHFLDMEKEKARR